MMTRHLVSIFLAAVIFLMATAACNKTELSNESGTEQLAVYLTDNPGRFSKLLMQINMVEVKLDTSDHRDDDSYGSRSGQMDDDDDDDDRGKDEYGQWDTLRIRAGTYDILALRNGVDTLLAQGTIRGKVRKIRITVGAVNVIVDSVSYPVNLMPGASNYLYVKVKDEHMRDSGSVKKIWLDFDVSRSIVLINGQYYLRPVLKPFSDKNTGEVEGEVAPREAQAVVRIYNSTDTASAIPDREGEFKVRGLKPGTYSILIDGSNGYRDTLINNVQVRRGEDTELGKVILRR
jgi:hypothetical protein